MEPQKNILTVPVSIIIAGVIIGGAVLLSNGGPAKNVFKEPAQATNTSITENLTLRDVTADDHILGNPNAKIVMVEFSDLECPFCKSFHTTMQTLIDQYGKTGNVAWVYRHFPLDIHPKAFTEAEASECALELGGNEKFWAYINKLLSVTPSNNGLDLTQLPKIAGQVGLNVTQFQTCLDSGKYSAKVKADYEDGLTAGVSGTPNTVLVMTNPITTAAAKRLSEINQSILNQLPPGSPNVITLDSTNKKVGIGGAFQLAVMKEIIDLILSGK
ncbi:MAG: thioredoxin domain-containing protein [Patescibacteria group bacterium]